MASGPEIGSPAPDFTLPGGVLSGDAFERRDHTLSSARGRSVVLAFYPGDNTAVCTRQLCSYSSGFEIFEGLDAEVWGISPQGVDSHEAFARAQGLRMPLLADTDREVARAYKVAAPGIGVRRSVFLIGPDGVLAVEARRAAGGHVPVDRHARRTAVRHQERVKTAGIRQCGFPMVYGIIQPVRRKYFGGSRKSGE